MMGENVKDKTKDGYSIPILTVDDFYLLSKKAKESFLDDLLYTIDEINFDIKETKKELKEIRKEIKKKERLVRRCGEDYIRAKYELDYYQKLLNAFPKLDIQEEKPFIIQRVEREVFYDIYPEKLELVLDYIKKDKEEFFSYTNSNIQEIKGMIKQEYEEKKVSLKSIKKQSNKSYVYTYGRDEEQALILELYEYYVIKRDYIKYYKSFPKVKKDKNTNITIFTKIKLLTSYYWGLFVWKTRNFFGGINDKITTNVRRSQKRSQRNYQKELTKRVNNTYVELYLKERYQNYNFGDYVDYDKIRDDIEKENTFYECLLDKDFFIKKEVNNKTKELKEQKEKLERKLKSVNCDIKIINNEITKKENLVKTYGKEKAEIILNINELKSLIKALPKVSKKSLLDFKDYLDRFYYKYPTKKEDIMRYLNINYKDLLNMTSTDISKLKDDFIIKQKELVKKLKEQESIKTDDYKYENGYKKLEELEKEKSGYISELEEINKSFNNVNLDIENKVSKEINENTITEEEIITRHSANKEILKIMPPRRKKIELKEKTGILFKKWGQALLYLWPVLVLLGVFSFYPIFNAFRLSFLVGYNAATGGYDSISFVHNFKMVVTSGNFVKPMGGTPASALFNTFFISIVSVPISIIIALAIAVGLSSVKKLRGVLQTIFFLPYITNSLAIGLVFAYVFQDRGGLFNVFLSWFKINGGSWIGSGANYWKAMFVLIVFSVWNGLAFKIMVFLSAILNIDKQYYQAAQIDKTSKWRQFTRITVPLVSPTIFYIVITSVIGSFKTYSSVIAIFGQKGGPSGANYNLKTVVFFIYDFFANPNNMPQASAASIILFAIILLLTVVQTQVAKRKVHY